MELINPEDLTGVFTQENWVGLFSKPYSQHGSSIPAKGE